MDDSANKILTNLAFGIGNIEAQMKEIETRANATALKAKEAFAKTNLTPGMAGLNSGQLTAQQAMVQQITAEGEAKRAATIAKGEAEISAIRAKQALIRQTTLEKEAQTELAIVRNQVEQEKLLYMQSRMNAFESKPTGALGLLERHATWMLAGGAIFGTLELLKEGIIDVETGMKGLSTVLPEVHESQEAFNEAEEDAINLMQKYGEDIDEVMTSARAFGRMYKDEAAVMGLVNNSVLMNVVDRVELTDAVRGNEAALAVYGKGLTSVNEIMAFSNHTMDSWTRLSHETMASATDLINITERASGAALVANTNFDQLMGLGSSSIRATGLPGANIGNMLKTVMAQLAAPTDKVEEKIGAIGVKMRDTNGALRSGYDILLDLSLATKDATASQEELANAEQAASSGKFQYAKVAALMGQFDEIVKNTARSINNQGMTLAMAGQQMDTVARKAGQLKATLVDMMSGAGDSGLRTTIKSLIDVLNQLFMGFNKVSPEVINMGLALLALKLAMNPIQTLYRQLLPLITTQTVITRAGTAAIVAETVATEAATVATVEFSMATAVATGGIALIVGAVAAWVYHMGQAEKKQLDLTQAQKDNMAISQQKLTQYDSETNFLDTMAKKRQQLTDKINSGKLNAQELAATNKDLAAIEEAVGFVIDDETKKRMASNGVKDDEISKIIELINTRKEEVKLQYQDQLEMSKRAIDGASLRILAYQAELQALQALEGAKAKKLSNAGFFETAGMFLNELNPFDKNTSQANNAKINGLDGKIAADKRIMDDNKKLMEDAQSALQRLATGDTSIQHTPGSGGDDADKKKNEWLDRFLDNTLSAAEAQVRLNDATQRGIDISEARQRLAKDSAMTMNEYVQGLKLQTGMEGLLEEQQKGLHTEADLYRDAITLLEAKQATLNTSTDKGREAYNKIGDEIANAKQKVDELGESWLGLEAKQRAVYGGIVKDIIQKFQNLSDLGIDMNDGMTKFLSSVNLNNLQLSDQYILLKQIKDTVGDIAETEVDKQIAASESRIASIQKEIDALDEQNESLEEQRQIQDALNSMNEARIDLAKAQNKLSNVQSEKNTRIFQNGRWGFIADPQAVKEAEQGVADANQKLIDAKESYHNTIESIDDKHYKKQLQDQIDAEKAKQEALKKSLNTMKEDIIKGGPEFQKAIQEIFGTNITPEFTSQLDTLVNMAQTKARQIQTAMEEALMSLGSPDTPLTSYDIGGPIPFTGPAIVHKGEYMLNTDNVKSLGGISGVRNMLSSVRFPKPISENSIVRASSSSTSIDKGTHITGNTINVPNVYDVSGFIRNLKQMA